jgi:hypothetical protein
VREPTIEIMCEPCGRRGRYNVERLIAEQDERLEQAPAATVWTRNKTEGDDKMAQTRFALVLLASLIASMALAETLSPEADACKASGLLALKQKYPQVKDVLIDLDSAKIIKADTTIESVPIRTVVIGDAYVERAKTTKPQTLVCVIGDKGKVLLTLFSDK